jgi:hypothetical protein
LPFLFTNLIIFLFLFSWWQFTIDFFLFFIILPLYVKYSVVFSL